MNYDENMFLDVYEMDRPSMEADVYAKVQSKFSVDG